MEPNMRIECKTERAWDGAIGVLNFVGNGEYRADNEKRIALLNVSNQHYYWLIDIIHQYFKEELGERAWRTEIDFYRPRKDKDDEKIVKENDGNDKITLHFIYGEMAARSAANGNLEDVLDLLENYDGSYVVREFGSYKEKEAYMQALEDLNGWNEFAVLEDSFYDSEIESFDKRHDEMEKKQFEH